MSELAAFNLDGRSALVTGGSRGIGRAIAIVLAQCGARVVLHARTEAEARTAIDAIAQSGRETMIPIAADLAVPGKALDLAKRAQQLVGHVDIAVLNASIQTRRDFAAVEERQFHAEIQINLLSGYQLLQHLAPAMAARAWGRILTIGSVQQVRPNPALSVYAATKSAQLNLVLNLAKLYAKSGVTVNNLAPGLIDTERNSDLKLDGEAYARLLDRIPAGSAGTADDCAFAALLLCSHAGRYITGVDLMVDGGLHLP